MDSLLRKVLSQAHVEQNQHYPPHIYDEHFNLATKWLVDECAKIFPSRQSVLEVIKSFMEYKDVRVQNGIIPLPENHRHTIGISIFVAPDYSCACDRPEDFDNDPLQPTELEVKRARLKNRSISKNVTLVQQSEWDDLTSHPYKKPTLKKPIACIFADEGIRIFPEDVPVVELRYIRQPKDCKYGYAMNPDDTYSWNPATTAESEWGDTATTYLFKAVNTLYAMYVRDQEQRDAALELKKIGLF